MLLGINTTISIVKNQTGKSANQHTEVKVEALSDSCASASIISYDIAKKEKIAYLRREMPY